ncbi:MAG: DUF6596 domain-containing protein [Gemmatimonas sp.]
MSDPSTNSAQLTTATTADDVPTLVAHIFRRWYARISSTLLRAAGTGQLDVVEDAVQESLLAALQHWPYRGIPAEPEAWLYQVARRKLLDRMARSNVAERAEPLLAATVPTHIPAPSQVASLEASALGDDELTMMFLSAHPSLTVDAQITLMLRTICGLTVPEISAALLVPERTIAQRVVRAKRILAAINEPFNMPNASVLSERLDVVMRAIYLLFTEGYAATRGDSTVRHELCKEAMRLITAVAATPFGATPEVFALAALLELQSSRLNARERANGIAIPLGEQDRNLWDRSAVSRGMSWLSRASSGDVISDYHLQAAIAAEHALTINGDATNWHRIRYLYEQLIERTPSPIVRLNHALAVARTDGARAGLELLNTLSAHPRLSHHHLLPAMHAVLYEELGQSAAATASTRVALGRARTLAGQALLAARLAELAPEITGAHTAHAFEVAEPAIDKRTQKRSDRAPMREGE